MVSSGRVLLRHAMRQMVLRVADSVAAKLHPIHADYEQRVAEQERLREEAAAKAPGGVAPSLPPDAVDAKWRTDKCKAGAKAVLKTSLVPCLMQEMAAGRQAAGDALEGRLRSLDEELARLEGEGGDAQPAAIEALQWRRFEMLRLWSRLGIPARPPYIL